MKKYLFIILIFIFTSGAYAQQLKLIGGLNISNYNQKWPSGFYWTGIAGLFRSPFRNSKIGFLGGFGVEFALNKTISLELEGCYFQKSSSYDYGFYYPITEVYSMKGISFPLLIKAKFLPQPFPYIIGGGEFLFILSHSRTTIEPVYYPEIKENILENTKKLDFGLVLGIGFEMKVSKVSCFLEGRYNLGQRNLYTSDEYNPYPPTIKTSALQILAGFKI